MEGIAKGIGFFGKEPTEGQRPSITEIDFKFSQKICTVSLGLNDQPAEKFRINYDESSFQTELDKQLKPLGLGLLDFTSITNLFQIKLVEQYLVTGLKESMLKINKFSSEKIFELHDNLEIQDLVIFANQKAT